MLPSPVAGLKRKARPPGRAFFLERRRCATAPAPLCLSPCPSPHAWAARLADPAAVLPVAAVAGPVAVVPAVAHVAALAAVVRVAAPDPAAGAVAPVAARVAAPDPAAGAVAPVAARVAAFAAAGVPAV